MATYKWKITREPGYGDWLFGYYRWHVTLDQANWVSMGGYARSYAKAKAKIAKAIDKYEANKDKYLHTEGTTTSKHGGKNGLANSR